MAGDQFRVQELNPFMEWHLPTNLFQVFRCQEQENRRERQWAPIKVRLPVNKKRRQGMPPLKGTNASKVLAALAISAVQGHAPAPPASRPNGPKASNPPMARKATAAALLTDVGSFLRSR